MDSYYNIMCLKRGYIEAVTEENHEEYNAKEKNLIIETVDISLDEPVKIDRW